MIELQVISPLEVIDPVSLQRELKAIVKEAIDEAEKHYKAVTETWEHDPNLERESGISGDDYYDQVGSDDGPMLWLDEGTSVRFSAVSEDFIPKTFVRELRSGPGAGDVYPSRTPHPGIDARKWTEEIQKLIEPKLNTSADKAIDKATR